MLYRFLLWVVLVVLRQTVSGGPSVALSWTGCEALMKWHPYQLREVTNTVDGVIYESLGTDPVLHSPQFDLTNLSPDQVVVIRAKIASGGKGELFHARPGEEGRHPQARARDFDWIGDDEWHEYRVRPCWHDAKSVRQIRLDMPAKAGVRVEISRVAVETDPISRLPLVGIANPSGGVAFTCGPIAETSWADIEWLGDEVGETAVRRHFHLVGDGRERRYYFDGARAASFEGNGLSCESAKKWRGPIRRFVVRNATTGEALPLRDVVFTDSRPEIPGELCLSATDVPLAFHRVGQAISVEIGLFNPGTMAVKGAKCVVSGLPDGVRVVDPSQASVVVDVPGWDSALHRMVLIADRPCAFTLKAAFSAPGFAERSVAVPIKVEPSLNLATADYVPTPKPLAKGRYEIGAFYFCDWVRPDQWMKIWRIDPKRKPALGWYDNREGEVMDWQIKWAVENGISYWLVDWYGRKGSHAIAHFETAYAKARFRKHMKWALMWCNHMPAGTSAEDAWDWLVDYWISHYFASPEYMRVEGKPYVSIWDPDCLDRDNGLGGCRRLLDKARAKAQAAGFAGIFFQAMNNDDRSAAYGAALQAKRREQGFDEATPYHYLGTEGRSAGPRLIAYADVVGTSRRYWKTVCDVPGIRYLPNLSTGWNDRPWNGGSVCAGKTPELFRRLCESAKSFADETGISRFCLAPLNEWGEGSYAEPNGEFGFDFYEAIRETFFEKPAEGWPLNYTPADVGRELHEVPRATGVVPQHETLKWR